MKIDNPIKLIPVGNSPKTVETSISSFNKPLADLLEHIGLPTENVLASIEERRKVIYSLESTLEILPIEERQKSFYLSRFTVAITVGLFDGALAFLWDETVKSLRKLIINFDLEYFFNVAETITSRYKNLIRAEDLESVSEHDLLEICRRIGLINDINFKRLEHVNYLRNHASSAHPNDNDISGIEMLSLLEHCLKYAITAQPDHSVIEIKQLMDNIRKNVIPDDDFLVIGEDIAKQPQERIDDLLLSIFGIYSDPRQDQSIKDNVEKLIPHVWESSTESPKDIIGAKFGKYRKTGDVDRKNATQRILELVNGLKYKDEDSLAAELIEKLQDLRSTHFEYNNFYNEYIHAKSIDESIPKTGIPNSARRLFVKIISLCYIGNGQGYLNGIDERALPYYLKFINSFEVAEIIDFIYLLQDSEFVIDFDMPKAEARVKKLVGFFKTKTTNVHVNKVLDLIVEFPSRQLHKISTDSRYKDAIKFIKKN